MIKEISITRNIHESKILAINIQIVLVVRRATHFPEWREKYGQLLFSDFGFHPGIIKIQLPIPKTLKILIILSVLHLTGTQLVHSMLGIHGCNKKASVLKF